MKRLWIILFRLFLFAGVVSGLLLLLPRWMTELYAHSRTHSVEDSPPAPVAVVFGAGLRRDGSPAAVLKDRVESGVALYRAGKVKKLLMTGDNRFVDYNEPAAMSEYAVSLGVPAEDIVADYAGRRTYDSCYRARHIFGVTEAIVVTQKFHLPRAIYICNALGVNATGVAADQRTYLQFAHNFWRVRELPATLVALWELWVTKPMPVLGNPEPIFPAQE